MGFKDKTPGPGSYGVETTLRTNGKSFGKENERAKQKKNGVPGPGQYATTMGMKEAAPKYGFGSESRDRVGKVSNMTPGPGNYKPSDGLTKKAAPRGLMVPRRPDSAPALGRGTPGPG